MDPFRDELAAAHEKIAQLEKEVLELKTDPFRPRPPPAESALAVRKRQILVLIAIVGGLIIVMLLGVIVLSVALGRAPVRPGATPAPLFSGIAIAPTAAVTEQEVATPRASSSSTLDKQNPYTNGKPCNCTPGDPLCSCL